MAATLRSAADGNLTLAAVPGPVPERKSRYFRQERKANVGNSGTGLQSRLGQPLDRHVVQQALDLARVEHAGAEVLYRLRPAGHREAQAVLRGAAAVARGDHAGE